MSTHPVSIKRERKQPNTLPLYHTHSNQGQLFWAFYWWVALAQDTGDRQESGPLWTLQSKTKSLHHPHQQTGSHGNGVHSINEKTLPREQRYLPLSSFKCYSEVIQCKHASGCSVSPDGASQQWQQDCVDMPEPAANSAEPTKSTQEAGHIITL